MTNRKSPPDAQALLARAKSLLASSPAPATRAMALVVLRAERLGRAAATDQQPAPTPCRPAIKGGGGNR